MDFIIGDEIAIEVKSTQRVSTRDLRGLTALGEEKKWKHLILVSDDPQPQTFGKIQCLHWREFLVKWWNRKFI